MASDEHQRATEGDEGSKVSRLLIGIPKIKAPADFGLRLQRRLTEERRRMLGRSVRLLSFASVQIPIYAASVIAIVGVSILAYYVLIRTGVTPEEFSRPEQKIEAVPSGDSLLMKEGDKPAEWDEQPAVFEKRSGRIQPRGGKAPSVTRSRELKDVSPAEDLRKMDVLELAVPSKAVKTEAESVQDKELDSIGTKQDSLGLSDDEGKEPTQKHE
ncbi:MAG: hypothetical protein ACE5H0_03710 [Bacteroidota bacterium]